MIEVLFFGAAADRAGTRQTGLEVRDGATLAEVWPLIVERHPDLGPMGGTVAYFAASHRGLVDSKIGHLK